MEVTYLVAVNIEDVSTIADQAADIQDDLESAGHDVVSVKPWARPTQQTASPIVAPSLIQPQQTTTQPEIQQ